MNSFIPAPDTPGIALPRLCDARGRLNPAAIGWSSRPQLNCAIPRHFGRRKRWNHWCVVSPDWMLSLTLADFDYLGYGALYFLDLGSGKAVTRAHLRPLGVGCRLPDLAVADHHFDHAQLAFRICEQPGGLRLTASAGDLGGQPLAVNLEIQRPGHLESVNLAVPLGAQGFHACSRQLGLPASGSLTLGQQRYHCSSGQSFAALDFGRGVWPLRSQWTRAAFASSGGLAANLGTGWTEASGHSENALWFGGELSRLQTELAIRPPEHATSISWQLRSACQRVDLQFTPLQHHHARPSIGLLFVDTRQWFGRFDGSLRARCGERVPVNGALGWLGSNVTRW